VIGTDTNVLLRHVLQDDAVQSPSASRFLAERSVDDPVFIGRLVLAETVWTLARVYRYQSGDLTALVRALLASDDVVVEDSASVRRAMWDAEQTGAELADSLIAHAAIDAGCDGIVTFDKRALKLPGMLPV